MSCSIFKNFHKPTETKSLILIAKDIASDKYKLKVEKIRSLLKEGKTEEAQELKKQLPAFTPSAVFKKRRIKEDVESYSGFVHLDFDKLTDEQIGKLRRALHSCCYTHIFFVSPSGRGIKVFIEVSSAKEDHDRAYRLVQAYYENLTGLKADPSCKDITRLCFMSYDPDIYRNLENVKFPVKKGLEGKEGRGETGKGEKIFDSHAPSPLPLSPSSPLSHEEVFNQQVQFTNRIKTYEEGSRNAYVYQLALNCNRAGLEEQTTIDLINRHYDLPAKEIQQTVKSAYKRGLEGLESLGSLEGLEGLDQCHPELVSGSSLNQECKSVKMLKQVQHDSDSQPSQPSQPSPQEVQLSQESQLSHPPLFSTREEDEAKPREIMPTLPDSIFETMPRFLQQVTSVAGSKEERDILLLGAMTALSVALHRLKGIYGDNPVSPNLFLFISAMASAGKGILTHCEQLVMPIHDMLRQQAKLLKESYDTQMLEYSKCKDGSVPRPQKPPQMMLIIPGNNSATGFLEILFDSSCRGLIFETEGDTIALAFQSEHGNFSDGFRKSYQHERIAYYRRTDKEHVEIKHPCLSVLLSGTPRQIEELIPSVENGLFSRFLFYVMNMNYEWKDVFASNTHKGLDQHFGELGRQFFGFYQHLETMPEMNFTLSADQRRRFNAFFSHLQNLYITIQNDNIISSVRRLGLSAYRMMMIFSALRLMETGRDTATVECNEVDFDNTLEMIAVLVQHSSHVFRQVGEEVKAPTPKNRKEKLLELLPPEFSRQVYLELASQLEIPASTAHRYIKQFVDAGIIYKLQYDTYLKLEVEVPKKEPVR